jgi:hypothetical protein
MPGNPWIGSSVWALAVFDDGSGPALYAGGFFPIAGGVTVSSVARWDGAAWSALDGGVFLDGHFGYVYSFAAFDDGSGPALYAGGRFDTASGVTVNNIARWDGSTWSDVGGGFSGAWGSTAHALAVFDDGSGPALYAGGWFDTAGSVIVNRVARWDATAWSSLGTGVGGALVGALAGFDHGSGPTLYAGGAFTSAGGLSSGNIAAWSCVPGEIFADGFEGGSAAAWSHAVP